MNPIRGELDHEHRTYAITTEQGEVLVLDITNGRLLRHVSCWPRYVVSFVLLVPSTSAPGQQRLATPASRVRNGILTVRSDADLEKLVSPASEVRTISTSDGLLTPAGAKRMKEFPQLRRLSIRGTFIDDSVLETMTTLRSLTLRDTEVTTEGLESLQKALPALRVRVHTTMAR